MAADGGGQIPFRDLSLGGSGSRGSTGGGQASFIFDLYPGRSFTTLAGSGRTGCRLHGAKSGSGQISDDALHVAIAVVGGIQVIVSWNFKHLVNFQRESGFNGVNLLQGYPSVRILSPLELIYDDEEKDL
jgi:hypothetical protein